jgi:hypothetical protein
MIANGDELVRTGEHPHAVRNGLGPGMDGHPVHRRAAEGEADPDLRPVSSAIAGREIAIDAPVDAVMLGTDVDRLGDFERRILLDLNVADEALNALLGLRGCCREKQQEGRDRPPEKAHCYAAGRSNDTFGALWIDGSSSW